MLCKQRELLARQESRFHPAKEIVHDRLCITQFLIPVPPDGSKRVWESLSQSTLSGTPCCRLTEMTVPKHSINPAIVEPSFAIRMKISPGCPFGYRPTFR